MNSLGKIARFTGFGYLVIFITGIFSNFFVTEGLINPDDAEATLINLTDSSALFRLGIFSFILMVLFDVILAWTLYELLKPVNRRLSLLSGWLRLVNGTIFGIALYHLFDVLHLTGSAAYLETMGTGNLQAMVMISLKSFNNTWLVGLIFFGLHLFFLGYLIMKSGYIPRVLGILLIIASIGYLIDSFANLLMPWYSNYENIFMLIVVIPGVVGELSFTIWLLLRGSRIDEKLVKN